MERMNCIFFGMLRILFKDYKWNWKKYFSKMIYVYNCIRNISIGYLFFYFIFGCYLRLLIDFIFGFDNQMLGKKCDYVIEWKKGLEEVY